jgi:hypothetical protein
MRITEAFSNGRGFLLRADDYRTRITHLAGFACDAICATLLSEELNSRKEEFMRTFDPWIGSFYESQGIRGIKLLILGESHYGRIGTEKRSFTANVIQQRGQIGRFRFFTTTQRLVIGGRGRLSIAEREDFWNRVAFYNYVQSFAGQKARRRPTADMWSAAQEPFLQTLVEVQPHVLLVLGRELRRHLPDIPHTIRLCEVQHPSSPGFKYSDWQPVVRAALDLAP